MVANYFVPKPQLEEVIASFELGSQPLQASERLNETSFEAWGLQQMEAGMTSALDAASTSLRRLVGSHDENLEHIGDDAVI